MSFGLSEIILIVVHWVVFFKARDNYKKDKSPKRSFLLVILERLRLRRKLRVRVDDTIRVNNINPEILKSLMKGFTGTITINDGPTSDDRIKVIWKHEKKSQSDKKSVLELLLINRIRKNSKVIAVLSIASFCLFFGGVFEYNSVWLSTIPLVVQVAIMANDYVTAYRIKRGYFANNSYEIKELISMLNHYDGGPMGGRRIFPEEQVNDISVDATDGELAK